MESTLVLGVLAGFVHGEDVSLGEHLLALLGLSTDLLNSLEGWVEVASTDEVTSIEGINLTISLEVIDIEGEFDVYDFKGDGKVDAFYAGDLIRACNLNPTLKTIE